MMGDMQERRLHPRYAVDWSVHVGDGAGESYDAVACNASLAGIGLEVTRAAIVGLARAGGMLLTGESFMLSSDATSPAIESVVCRTVVVRRVAQDRYVVGASFVDLSETQQAAIGELIEQAKPGAG